MVWLGEDGDGDIIEVPLACEIELASTQAAIDEDFRKLLLSNAAMKVLVCRTEHLFDLNTPLDKMARAGLIHEGDFWYVAHFGIPGWARETRTGQTVGFDWEKSWLYEYPKRMEICDGKLKHLYSKRPFCLIGEKRLDTRLFGH
jgi:hypothetical protein